MLILFNVFKHFYIEEMHSKENQPLYSISKPEVARTSLSFQGCLVVI